MSDDSSTSPPRHWHGQVGSRHEHQNVWMNGGVRSTAPSAPWAGWDADKKRRVRSPSLQNTHPNYVLTLTNNGMFRNPNHPQNQPKKDVPAATENHSLSIYIPRRGAVSRTRAMRRGERVMRRCCLRKGFLQSGGMDIRRGRSNLLFTAC